MTSARLLALGFCAVLAACEASQTPRNAEDLNAGEGYQAEYRDTIGRADVRQITPTDYLNATKCSGPDPITRGHRPIADLDVLSSGDLVRIFVENDETFSGNYVVNRDGTLRLPFTPPVRAMGRTAEAVAQDVAGNLLAEGFYDVSPRVSVLINDFAAAQVDVAGAVFEPGGVVVGGGNAQTRDPLRQEALGAFTFSRTLSSALASAGGVRPDADLANVVIHRGRQHILVDARPAITGRAFNDLLLVSGDRIEVPSRKCFQEELMVPSRITAPGVKVFMSNLIVPATDNASAAIGREARELRYGTRFLQAAVGMNCVGGSKLTNANRSVALLSRNPITGESVVIERRIEDLLRRADRDEFDPYILPNDALACYDSGLVDVVDLARSFGVIGALIYIGSN